MAAGRLWTLFDTATVDTAGGAVSQITNGIDQGTGYLIITTTDEVATATLGVIVSALGQGPGSGGGIFIVDNTFTAIAAAGVNVVLMGANTATVAYGVTAVNPYPMPSSISVGLVPGGAGASFDVTVTYLGIGS